MREQGMILSVGLFLLSGCGHVEKSLSKGQIKETWNEISDKDYLRFRGIGAAPASTQDDTQRHGLARNAALVAARYEALGYLKGLTLKGGLKVSMAIAQDSEIKEEANRLISGAEEYRTEWTKDGGAVVILQLKRADVDALIERDRPYEPKQQ